MPPPSADARDDRFRGDPGRPGDAGRDPRLAEPDADGPATDGSRRGGRRRAAEPDPPRNRSGGRAVPVELADEPPVFGPPQEIGNGRDPLDHEPPGEFAPEPVREPRPMPEVPVRRLVSLALGGLSALLAVALVVGAQLTHPKYAFVVFGVQVLFVVVWTVSSQPPAPRVVVAIGVLVAGAADAASVLVSPASLAPLAYVVAGGFLAGVLGQLARRAGRVRVTESLGSSLVVVLGAVSYATLVVLSRNPLGTQVIDSCVVGVGVALVTAHLADVVAPVLRVAPQVPRGGLGVVLGAMLGTACAGLTGSLVDGLATLPTAIAGLIAAVIALMVDLSANYAEASRSLAGAPPALWLVRHMQGPLAALALAAPTAYAASLVLARGL